MRGKRFHPVAVSIIAACVGVLLSGCGSIQLDATAPAGFDLSGHWIATDESVSSRSGGFRTGFMGQDFPLLFTREMRIEQDARSMGIEYGGGRYRDVSWGERRSGIWEVNAGWYEGDLRIYSEASDTSGIEIWQLSEDGQELIIDVQVEAGRTERFHRTFSKSTGA
jgi:hypothetical protein